MKTIEREETKTQTQTPFQAKDVLSQVVIAALAVGPDASSIVYVKRTVEDGKYARRLWRTNFDGTGPEQLTSARASDNRPRFSPDGRSLVFISDRTGKPQAWVIKLTGGEPRQIARLNGGIVNLAWAPGNKIAFLGTDQPGSPGWADLELHVDDRRLAADRHLNIQVTSYGDYQDGELFGPPPLTWQDEEHLIALVSHHGYAPPYRFGV